MRYEVTIKVTCLVDVVVDEPGMTLAEAKSKVRSYPESYKVMFPHTYEFEEWDEPLVKTEDDAQPEEEDGDDTRMLVQEVNRLRRALWHQTQMTESYRGAAGF